MDKESVVYSISFSFKKEILIHATWMKLVDITLSHKKRFFLKWFMSRVG